jgi:hypothetical protein
MFLLTYFRSCGSIGVLVLAPLSLIPAMRLYLTGFLKRIFSGEIALNRVFFREKTQRLQALTISRLTKARRRENRRDLYAIFTSRLAAFLHRQPAKACGLRF